MESRTRLAIGGVATVAASVAVVCAVAVTTSVALADSAGKAVEAQQVVVPLASASPVPSPSPTVLPATPVTPPVTPQTDVPETVPAPVPEDVAAPPSSQVSDEEPPAVTEEVFIAEAIATGSWNGAYAWAEKRGWSQERIAAWIARLDEKRVANGPPISDLVTDDDRNGLMPDDDLQRGKSENADNGLQRGKSENAGDRIGPMPPAEADETSEPDPSGQWFGSKREQSRVPPD